MSARSGRQPRPASGDMNSPRSVEATICFGRPGSIASPNTPAGGMRSLHERPSSDETINRACVASNP